MTINSTIEALSEAELDFRRRWNLGPTGDG
jgi:hypothetical protein